MAKTTHISIFADCTIRDIFGICDLEQKYVIDTNISSIHPFSVSDKKIIEYSRIGGVEREEKEIFGKLESFFVRNIKLDLTKNFDGISGENSEFLLFHMSNIRFGLFRDLHDEGRRLTCVTRWDKWFNYIGNLSKRNFLPKEYEIMEAYELCEDEFYGYIDDFMEKLLRNFQEEQLILFEVYLSDDMVSAGKDRLRKDQGYDWLPSDDWFVKVNERIAEAHVYIRNKWPHVHVVESPEPILAYEGHKWGKYPTHFLDEYYEYAYAAMNVIVKYANEDRDTEQMELKILKKKYDYVFFRIYANLKMNRGMGENLYEADWDVLIRRLDKSIERWTWDRYLRIQDRLMPEVMKRLECIDKRIAGCTTME